MIYVCNFRRYLINRFYYLFPHSPTPPLPYSPTPLLPHSLLPTP
ncbi:MAG: hypothetical protein SWX82_11730 [Cyanobacteriota bacterium]|nr:hypothetical protein [Cyanobacteriota bacterium]